MLSRYLKRAFLIASITSIVLVFYSFSREFSFCDSPIYYRIGFVDPKFKVDKDLLVTDLADAAKIWNQASGKNILEYSDTADLTVNLVYDERQRALVELSMSEDEVIRKKSALENELKSYESSVKDLNKKIDDLNKEIAYWNSKGGAPEGEYEKIIKERDSVIKSIESFNRKSAQINSKIELYNSQVVDYKNTVDEYNKVVQEKPEAGLYTSASNTIDIFFYDSRNTFIHTAAHEFGHAMGMEHSESPQSIMHPVSSDVLQLSMEDRNFLNDYCKPRSLAQHFSGIISELYSNTLGR